MPLLYWKVLAYTRQFLLYSSELTHKNVSLRLDVPLVALAGFEPTTSRLWALRAGHCSTALFKKGEADSTGMSYDVSVYTVFLTSTPTTTHLWVRRFSLPTLNLTCMKKLVWLSSPISSSPYYFLRQALCTEADTSCETICTSSTCLFAIIGT